MPTQAIEQEETIPTQIVEEIVLEPTPFPTPQIEVVEEKTVKEVVEPKPRIQPTDLTGHYKIVTLESEDFLEWYRLFWKELQVKQCTSECTTEDIERLLKPENNEWVIVQDGWVFYVHSGWPIERGPSFGQLFILILRHNEEALIGTSFCLEDICFEIVNYIFLGRDEIGGLVYMDELFDTEEGEYFLTTCSETPQQDLSTPKLFLQLKRVP